MAKSDDGTITKKSIQEIEYMYEAGQIAGGALAMLRENIRPGITTDKLNKLAHQYIVSRGAYPVFLGYCDYPKSICTSVNCEVVHGIPSKRRILEEGDIVSIDVGVLKNNYCGDAAITVPVGAVGELAKRLIRVTEEALAIGINQAIPGAYLGDLSNAVQLYVESNGFSVVRDYVGHGIGQKLHEPPSVPNFGRKGVGVKLEPGFCLAIEPMVNAGKHHVYTESNSWTVVTADKSLSAHFEHTVAITENGPRILSKVE